MLLLSLCKDWTHGIVTDTIRRRSSGISACLRLRAGVGRLGRKDSYQRRLRRPTQRDCTCALAFFISPPLAGTDAGEPSDCSSSSSVPANIAMAFLPFYRFFVSAESHGRHLPLPFCAGNREDKSDRKPSSRGAYNRGSSSFATKIYKFHPGILHIYKMSLPLKRTIRRRRRVCRLCSILNSGKNLRCKAQ